MLDSSDRFRLRKIAQQAIEHGLHNSHPFELDLAELPETLSRHGASFVTLHKYGNLRGCIGSLEAFRPLAEDVAFNAHAAAFSDPRFSPLLRNELPLLDIEISVLSAATPINCRNEQELLDQLQPFTDGLIIEDKFHRATFLPSVWEQLPEPHDFVRHLKLKAGLPASYWSDDMQCYRYSTESF